MKKAKGKPVIGRPAGRKPLLNLRIEQTLHDRLKRASEQSGRTLSEETVRRLENSFHSENQSILHVLFTVATTEPKWIDDGSNRRFRPIIKELMKLTIGDFIDSLPEPENQPRKLSDEEYADFVAKMNEKTASQKKERE